MAKNIKTQAVSVSTVAATAAKPATFDAAAALRGVNALRGKEKVQARKALLASLPDADAKAFRALAREQHKASRADAAPRELIKRLRKGDTFLTKAMGMLEMVKEDDEAYGTVSKLAKVRVDLTAIVLAFGQLANDGWAPPTARKVAKRAIEAGTVMSIRPKARETFEGILEASEMDNLTVLKVVKGVVFARTAGGDRVMINRSKLTFAK